MYLPTQHTKLLHQNRTESTKDLSEIATKPGSSWASQMNDRGWVGETILSYTFFI